jgi:hypothetical protein
MNSDSNADNDGASEVLPLPIAELLSRWSLRYLPQIRCLVCKLCKSFVSEDFVQHIRKRHKIFISIEEFDMVKTKLEIVPFNPQVNINQTGSERQLFDPFEDVELYEGFECNSCFKCFRTEKNMKSHVSHDCAQSLSALDEEKPYTPCKLQAVHSGTSAPMFRVREVKCSSKRSCLEDAIIKRIRLNNESPVEKMGPMLADMRHMFYQQQGWFVNKNLHLGTHLYQQDIPSYFKCPFPSDSLSVSNIRNIVQSIMRDACHAPAMLRAKPQVFSSNPYLVSIKENTVRRYSLVICQLIWFMFNLSEKPLNGLTVARVNLEILRKCWSRSALINVIYQCVQQKAVGVESSVFEVFMMSKCIRSANELAFPSDISPIAAALNKFIASTGICFELDFIEASKTDHNSDAEHIGFWQSFKERSGSVTLVHSVLRLAQDHGKREAKPTVNVCHDGSIVVCGKTMHLSQIPLGILMSLKDCGDLIHQWNSQQEIEVDLQKIQDSLGDVKYGVSIVSLNSRYQEALIERWFQKQGHFNRSTSAIPIPIIRKLISLHDRLVDNLVVAIHLSTGFPGRSTELENYLVANETSFLRTVMFAHGRVFFKPQYGKNDNRRGSHKFLTRWCSPVLSKMILYLLLVMRPLIEELVIRSGSEESLVLKNFGNRLFAHAHRVLTANEISSIFGRKWLERFNHSVSFKAYRHATRYMFDLSKCRPLSASPIFGSDTESEIDEDAYNEQ